MGKLHALEALAAFDHSPIVNGVSSAVRDATRAVIIEWTRRWAHDRSLRSFINHTRFLEEIEEALVPISLVVAYLNRITEQRAGQHEQPLQEPYTVFDLCAGKGFVSMLLAWLALFLPEVRNGVRELVMVDKAGAKIHMHHIEASNASRVVTVNINALHSDAPPLDDGEQRQPLPIRFVNADLHDTYLLEKLSVDERTRGIIIGIHMCRRLAPRACQLYSAMPSCFDCLVLSPCCVPPAGSPMTLNGRTIDPAELDGSYDAWVAWLTSVVAASDERDTSATTATVDSTTTTTTTMPPTTTTATMPLPLQLTTSTTHTDCRCFLAPLKGGPHRRNAFIVSTRPHDRPRERPPSPRLFRAPDASQVCLRFWYHSKCSKADRCRFQHTQGGLRSCAETGARHATTLVGRASAPSSPIPLASDSAVE